MVEWKILDGFMPYEDAVILMEDRVAAIIQGTQSEQILMVEHPPLYTAGTSANRADLVDADRFPVYETKRGGQYTYHGPGQRVCYAMLDLNIRGKDIRKLVWRLEEWLIQTLAEFDVIGERRKGRVGVWVVRKDKPLTVSGCYREDKIGAIGVRLRKWVSFHGVSINVNPDLSHYNGIIPCGINEHGVTSLSDLGCSAKMSDVDDVLKSTFEHVFEIAF